MIPEIPKRKKKSKEEMSNKKKICQHFIDWGKMKSLSKNDERRETYIYKFVKKFATQVFNEDRVKHVVCKSCSTVLNISNYLADGEYDSAGNFISFYSVRTVALRDHTRYSELPKIIEYLDNALQLLGDNMGLLQYSEGKIIYVRKIV